ncbi:hypothetical protein BGX38DRAFT_1163122 [Terfezia claveryi]|nr:hypothetical protein BGX38DRAFT_1163122 [Terfezia claveryi]
MLKRAVQEAAEGRGLDKEQVGAGEDNILGVGVDIDKGVIEAIRDGWQAKGPDNDIEEDLATEESKSVYWAPLLQTVLWAYRCSRHTSTGYSPAMLAFGMELRLPVDTVAAEENMPKTITEEKHREEVSRKIRWLTEGIPGLRELKTKEMDISSFKQYELGQRVWKRESKYDGKGFAPVFAPRWTGPFVIHSVWDKNVYKLRTDPLITGKVGGVFEEPHQRKQVEGVR